VSNGPTIVEAVLVGMFALIVGTVPRNVVFAANLRYFPHFPWSVLPLAVYLWLFWRYLGGWGPPRETSDKRRASLRATPLSLRVWIWALLAGAMGLVTLLLALRLANRMIALPDQASLDLSGVPVVTVLLLLLMSSVFAGVVEEASFRGYMQRPIERRHGPALAILVTGVMFAVAHLDFTPTLLPYYVAVAAIYGMVTYLTDSILPAVALHAGGNFFSNIDLWRRGRAEWQSLGGGETLIWSAGTDASFWTTVVTVLVSAAAMVWAYSRLAGAAKTT
jgi:membrane protease YdiL (CAAX protease family)